MRFSYLWSLLHTFSDLAGIQSVGYYPGSFCSRFIVNRSAQGGTALVNCCCTAAHTGATGDGFLPDEVGGKEDYGEMLARKVAVLPAEDIKKW